MGKNVCFLVSEHPFLDARIFKKEAKSLVKHGYRVTMIVPRKNGHLFDVDGTVFLDKYLKKQFVHEQVKVITYEQIFPQKRLKYLHRNLKDSRFSDRPMNSLIELGLEQNADIYHAHEFYSLYAGVRIKQKLSKQNRQVKLIYDSHELEPDPLIRQSERLRSTQLELLKLMLYETDFVITVSNSIKAWFQSICEKLPVEVIYNSPPLPRCYEPGEGKNKELVLVYEGVMNARRGGFAKLIEIANKCNQLFPLKVVIIGGNKKTEKPLSIPDHLKDKVIHVGWVEYDGLPEVMAAADLGWVDVNGEQSLSERFSMPNKFFSYLSNGIPVLTHQCKDMKGFIRKYDCGYVVNGLKASAEEYVQALQFLNDNREIISKMSKNARKTMKDYSWEEMEKRLVSIYDRVTDS